MGIGAAITYVFGAEFTVSPVVGLWLLVGAVACFELGLPLWYGARGGREAGVPAPRTFKSLLFSGFGAGARAPMGGLQGEQDAQAAENFELEVPCAFLEGSVSGITCGGQVAIGDGRVVNKTNQDRAFLAHPVLADPTQSLFGVFDGHGENGEGVAAFAAREVPLRLEAHAEATSDPASALRDVYVDINTALPRAGVSAVFGGTTAVVGLVRRRRMWVANAGDSRAVVASRGRGGGIVGRALTWDQNPNSPGERERIEGMGGFVSDPEEEGVSSRVWLDRAMTMVGLAMSRSLGDLAVKRVGVICEPEVAEHTLTDRDEFLIVATDGLWEFVDTQEAVEVVQQALEEGEDASGACRRAVSLAKRRWVLMAGDYRDDITVILIRLPFLPLNARDSTAKRRHSTAAAATAGSSAGGRSPRLLGAAAPGPAAAAAGAAGGGEGEADEWAWQQEKEGEMEQQERGGGGGGGNGRVQNEEKEEAGKGENYDGLGGGSGAESGGGGGDGSNRDPHNGGGDGDEEDEEEDEDEDEDTETDDGDITPSVTPDGGSEPDDEVGLVPHNGAGCGDGGGAGGEPRPVFPVAAAAAAGPGTAVLPAGSRAQDAVHGQEKHRDMLRFLSTVSRAVGTSSNQAAHGPTHGGNGRRGLGSQGCDGGGGGGAAQKGAPTPPGPG